jgi:hypothetical protein
MVFTGRSSVYKFVSSRIEQLNPFLVHGLKLPRQAAGSFDRKEVCYFCIRSLLRFRSKAVKQKAPSFIMTEEMGLYFFVIQ